MNGQKVVKVFCHEEAAIEEFNELNDRAVPQRRQGQRATSICCMPVNGQHGQPELRALRCGRRCAGHRTASAA